MNKKITAVLAIIVTLITLQIHAFENKEEELAHICMLTAYTLVAIDWQSEDNHSRRGHNIGCVMFDIEAGRLVSAGLDCTGHFKNNTAHAETMCIRNCQKYIRNKKPKTKKEELLNNPDQYLTISTTLEPDAQCAGMTMMQPMIRNVVYGQTNPEGKVIERLQFDSSGKQNGYPSYPAKLLSSQSKGIHAKKLDDAYKDPSSGYKNIIDFLQGKAAKKIFDDANLALSEYVKNPTKIEFPANYQFVKLVDPFIIEFFKGQVINVTTNKGYVKTK